MFSKVTLSCYQNIPQKPPCDIHSLTNCSLTFHTVNYPTNHSIRRTYLYRFCVLTFLYFLISFLGCKNGIKTEILARFFYFLDGTVFVPYPRYEKVSRRYILSPY